MVTADSLLHTRTDGRGRTRVLDVKDRLPSPDERLEDVALLILETLLIDSPLHHIDSRLVDNLSSILEAYRHVEPVCTRCQKSQIINSICLGEVETSVEAVPVDIVWVHAIAAFRRSELEPPRHDPSHVRRLGVEPVLARPPIERLVIVVGLELRGIGAEILEAAGREIADHVPVQCVQLADGGGWVLEEVDVVDGYIWRGVVQGGGEHDLPRYARGRLPEVAVPGCGGVGRGWCRTNGAGFGTPCQADAKPDS